MVITTSFGGVMEKWIEQQVGDEIYRSPQELVRDAVRRLREMSMVDATQLPSEKGEGSAKNQYGTLLDEIPGNEINVNKDYRVPVGAKGGRIVELTFLQLPSDATIKITAKVPGYDRTYKGTPWFFLERSETHELELHRSEEHPNRWIVHQPPEQRDDGLEVYVLDFQGLVEVMEGYNNLEFRSLATIRFHNLLQENLVFVRIYEGL